MYKVKHASFLSQNRKLQRIKRLSAFLSMVSKIWVSGPNQLKVHLHVHSRSLYLPFLAIFNFSQKNGDHIIILFFFKSTWYYWLQTKISCSFLYPELLLYMMKCVTTTYMFLWIHFLWMVQKCVATILSKVFLLKD